MPSSGLGGARILFANLATHPAVWFIIPEFPCSYRTQIVISELWAPLIEGAVYTLAFRGVSAKRAFAVSILANGFSFGVGVALRALTDWI